MKLETFDDVLASITRNTKRPFHLLVGNGFSIAYDPKDLLGTTPCTTSGKPDHVVESITGHLSRRMLEHYSHIRLNAKKQALDRAGKGAAITSAK